MQEAEPSLSRKGVAGSASATGPAGAAEPDIKTVANPGAQAEIRWTNADHMRDLGSLDTDFTGAGNASMDGTLPSDAREMDFGFPKLAIAGATSLALVTRETGPDCRLPALRRASGSTPNPLPGVPGHKRRGAFSTSGPRMTPFHPISEPDIKRKAA